MIYWQEVSHHPPFAIDKIPQQNKTKQRVKFRDSQLYLLNLIAWLVVCVCACVCECACMYMWMCVSMCACESMCVSLCVCVYACVCMCLQVCMIVSVHVCVSVHACTCEYVWVCAGESVCINLGKIYVIDITAKLIFLSFFCFDVAENWIQSHLLQYWTRPPDFTAVKITLTV